MTVPTTSGNSEADNLAKQLAPLLGRELNKHGYSFHQRVMREAGTAFESARQAWRFIASEYPVEVKGRPTHVDCILASDIAPDRRAMLLIECKRVNPALGAWAFCRSQFVRRNRDAEALFLDRATVHMRWGVGAVGVQMAYKSSDYYHVGIPLRIDGQAGDQTGGSDRDAITQAVDQACKGVNGVINEWGRLATHSGELESRTVYLVPVVVTTAKIFVSDVDLSAADLATGEIEPCVLSLSPRPWILYQAHVSPGIRHDHPAVKVPHIEEGDNLLTAVFKDYRSPNAHIGLDALLDRDHIRTVPIVTASGLGEFLKTFEVKSSAIDKVYPSGWI